MFPTQTFTGQELQQLHLFLRQETGLYIKPEDPPTIARLLLSLLAIKQEFDPNNPQPAKILHAEQIYKFIADPAHRIQIHQPIFSPDGKLLNVYVAMPGLEIILGILMELQNHPLCEPPDGPASFAIRVPSPAAAAGPANPYPNFQIPTLKRHNSTCLVLHEATKISCPSSPTDHRLASPPDLPSTGIELGNLPEFALAAEISASAKRSAVQRPIPMPPKIAKRASLSPINTENVTQMQLDHVLELISTIAELLSLSTAGQNPELNKIIDKMQARLASIRECFLTNERIKLKSTFNEFMQLSLHYITQHIQQKISSPIALANAISELDKQIAKI